MSILIKGMEMPTNCESCPCKTADAFGGLGCQATGYIPLRKANQDRPDNCPLVPVPPHGRLVDADAMIEKYDSLPHRYDRSMVGMISNCDLFDTLVYDLREEPTIIPAEEV